MKTNAVNYGTDWNNVDLSSPSERSLNILEPMTFDDAILQADCNLPSVHAGTVYAELKRELDRKYKEALEILRNNAGNIAEHVLSQREV